MRFKHSGKLGDIVYSLPAIQALGGGSLYISTQPFGEEILPAFRRKVLMDEDSITGALEFFVKLPGISEVHRHRGEDIDYNLDLFRNFECRRRHLARWYLRAFGVRADLSLPWVFIDQPVRLAPIVIQHSMRYFRRNDGFRWDLLKAHAEKCVFLGFSHEWQEFGEYTGLKLPRHQPKSLLEMAQIIAGASLFIGNQSLGFAMAEAIKRPRVQQVSLFEPNCLPQSINGHTRLTESIILRYLKGNPARRPLVGQRAFVASRNVFHTLRYYGARTVRYLRRK